MENVLKVAKYQLWDFRKSVLIYYFVIVGLIALLLITTTSNHTNVEGNFSGGTFIFIFIQGLNCFKSSFRFMQANNVSRRMFHMGTIVAMVSLSSIMSLIDIFIDYLLNYSIIQAGMFEQVYRIYDAGSWVFAKFSWNFTLYILATSLGYMITMIYYRSNTIMKIVNSIIPVVTIIFLSYLNRLTNGFVGYVIGRFMINALGLNGSQNPYSAVFSFTIASIGILSLSYLLIFKAPIRD